MSAVHERWARTVGVANKSQRLALDHLARLAAEDGTVNGAVSALLGLEGINTQRGADRVLLALLNAGHLTKQWIPDKYVWQYRLHGPK